MQNHEMGKEWVSIKLQKEYIYKFFFLHPVIMIAELSVAINKRDKFENIFPTS